MEKSVTAGLYSALPITLALWAAILIGANWALETGLDAGLDQSVHNAPGAVAEQAGPA